MNPTKLPKRWSDFTIECSMSHYDSKMNHNNSANQTQTVKTIWTIIIVSNIQIIIL